MDTLRSLKARMDKVAAARKRKVKEWRQRGMTWAEIGDRLGVSRQRAQVIGR